MPSLSAESIEIPSLPLSLAGRHSPLDVTSLTRRVSVACLFLPPRVFGRPNTDAKFGGHRGCPVRTLMGSAKSGTGIFGARDGLRTESIPFEILVRGILLHSDAKGEALQSGGPLRLWFPEDAGLRCASGNPLAVKDVCKFELTVSPTP